MAGLFCGDDDGNLRPHSGSDLRACVSRGARGGGGDAHELLLLLVQL